VTAFERAGGSSVAEPLAGPAELATFGFSILQIPIRSNRWFRTLFSNCRDPTASPKRDVV